MVAALDPHSAYLDSSEFEEIRLSTMGSYPAWASKSWPRTGGEGAHPSRARRHKGGTRAG